MPSFQVFQEENSPSGLLSTCQGQPSLGTGTAEKVKGRQVHFPGIAQTAERQRGSRIREEVGPEAAALRREGS